MDAVNDAERHGGGAAPERDLFAGIDPIRLKSLYRKLGVIMGLAPWNWLGPGDSFGILPHGLPEPVFLHFNHATDDRGEDELVLAFGWNASLTLELLAAGALDHGSMRLYEQPLVRCRMRTVSEMTPVERAFLTLSGFPVGADGRAPVFVCYRPGWLPWMLQAEDVPLCETILDQGLGVLLRSESDPSIVRRTDPAVAWVRSVDDEGRWGEEWEAIPPLETLGPTAGAMASEELIRKADALPLGPEAVEVDLDVLPQFPFLKPGELARFKNGLVPLGYFLAMCDAGPDVRPDKSCICNCVIYSGGDLLRMWNAMAGSLLEFFLEAGRRPREIIVSSHRMMDFLRPLQTKLRFKLTFHRSLPNFEAVLARSRAMIQESLREQGEGEGEPEGKANGHDEERLH